ncbi:MAG: hypothetical protein J5715_01225 [Clostridiales bacterium]|nr:hypothetical protein [Clostridiales bacterium]
MGAGYHGGFGPTKGSRAAPGSVKLVQPKPGDNFGKFALKAKPLAGFTDVIVHGDVEKDMVAVYHNGKWENIDQRRLSTFIRHNSGYKSGPIRLISCNMGASIFSQHLANKLGVKVLAPSDTVWAHPSGKLTIGPTSYINNGHWIEFNPERRGH